MRSPWCTHRCGRRHDTEQPHKVAMHEAWVGRKAGAKALRWCRRDGLSVVRALCDRQVLDASAQCSCARRVSRLARCANDVALQRQGRSAHGGNARACRDVRTGYDAMRSQRRFGAPCLTGMLLHSRVRQQGRIRTAPSARQSELRQSSRNTTTKNGHASSDACPFRGSAQAHALVKRHPQAVCSPRLPTRYSSQPTRARIARPNHWLS